MSGTPPRAHESKGSSEPAAGHPLAQSTASVEAPPPPTAHVLAPGNDDVSDPPASPTAQPHAHADASSASGAGSSASAAAATTEDSALLGITNFRSVPFTRSIYVRPGTLMYNQGPIERRCVGASRLDGVVCACVLLVWLAWLTLAYSRLRCAVLVLVPRWDVVQSFNACGCLLYHVERECFVLVRQFRAPVHYVNLQCNPEGHPPPHPRNAFTIEVCAGLADKPGKSSEQTMKEEILEECGYDVPVSSLELVNVIRGNVGLIGNICKFYYCEVHEIQRVGTGGGLADEDIEVLHLPVDDVVRLMDNPQVPKTSSCMCVLVLVYFFVWSCLPRVCCCGVVSVVARVLCHPHLESCCTCVLYVLSICVCFVRGGVGIAQLVGGVVDAPERPARVGRKRSRCAASCVAHSHDNPLHDPTPVHCDTSQRYRRGRGRRCGCG